MQELFPYLKAVMQLPDEIKAAEAEAEKNDVISTGVINRIPSGMAAACKTALFIRAQGERTGMVYTQNLESDPSEVIWEAYQNSLYVNCDHPESMKHPNAEDKDKMSYEQRTKESELQHSGSLLLQQKAEAVSDALYRILPEMDYLSVQVSETIRSMGIVNTYGVADSFSCRIVEASLSLTLEQPVHRSFSVECSVSELEELNEQYFITRVCEWKELPMNPVQMSGTAYKAVLDGSVMCNILLTAWQMFAGPQYLGSGTPLAGQLHAKLFGSKVNLVDDPGRKGLGYARKFDCEGSLSQKTSVIENGIFHGLLHNLDSAAKMRTNSSGNAGRDVNLISDQTQIRVIPTNFILENGEVSKQELLSQLKDGIYIYESYDMFHSLNTASGDFAIPCKGILYRNGIPAGTAEGLTISGNLIRLLADVLDIGNDTNALSVVMSKSFQVLSPSVLVKELQVTGG